MLIRGLVGSLRVGGRVAAELGEWRFERDRGAKHVEVEAHIASKDEFLITRTPLEIKLDALSKTRKVESFRIEGQQAHIIVEW